MDNEIKQNTAIIPLTNTKTKMGRPKKDKEAQKLKLIALRVEPKLNKKIDLIEKIKKGYTKTDVIRDAIEMSYSRQIFDIINAAIYNEITNWGKIKDMRSMYGTSTQENEENPFEIKENDAEKKTIVIYKFSHFKSYIDKNIEYNLNNYLVELTHKRDETIKIKMGLPKLITYRDVNNKELYFNIINCCTKQEFAIETKNIDKQNISGAYIEIIAKIGEFNNWANNLKKDIKKIHKLITTLENILPTSTP